MIAAAHQTMLAPPALPYDAEVEYLESTGAQYIDTGIRPGSSTRCVFDAMIPNGAAGCLFGVVSRENGTTYRYMMNVRSDTADNLLDFYAGASTTPARFGGISRNAWHTYILDGPAGLASVDGSSQSLNFGNLQLSAPVFIFARKNTVDDRIDNPIAVKIRAVSIYDSGVLVRDYIPVRKNGVGYLYDRVSKTLFGNAGTGAFTIGPDK